MGKAINAFVSASDETSENVQGTRLVFLDFINEPKTGSREKFIPSKSNREQHDRIVTAVREVKYLRDGYVKEENTTRKVVLESYGTEIVSEVLVPRSEGLTVEPKIVGQVVRDLRRKEQE